MTDNRLKEQFVKTKGILIPVLVGIFGYFIIFGVPWVIQEFLKQRIWSQIFLYNHYLDYITYYQGILLLIGSCLAIGYITALILEPEIKNLYDAIICGSLSGFTTGILYALLNIPFLYLTELRLIAREVIFHVFTKVLINLGLIVLVQVIGACIFFKWGMKPDVSQISQNKVKRVITSVSKPSLIIILSFIIILIFPIGIVYCGIQTGLIGWKPHCYMPPDHIAFHRLDSNSVKIKQYSESECFSLIPKDSWLPSQKSPYWKIFVDGKEMSNTSIIERQGLPDTINPSEGLVYGYGSVVVLTGPDLFSNRTDFTNISVVEYLPSGSIWTTITNEL